MVKDGRTHWDGVRNFQAANNMRAMKQGDRAFFYHSNEGKEIVGVVEIVRPFYPDPADPGGKFGMVDVAPVEPVKQPVGLAEMKGVPELAGMALLRQSRLSVCPVSDAEWSVICRMAGIAGMTSLRWCGMPPRDGAIPPYCCFLSAHYQRAHNSDCNLWLNYSEDDGEPSIGAGCTLVTTRA